MDGNAAVPHFLSGWLRGKVHFVLDSVSTLVAFSVFRYERDTPVETRFALLSITSPT